MSNSSECEEVAGSQRPPLELSEQHLEALSKQDSRPLTEFKAKKFKEEAQKHWDLFYKRNEDRFFKVKHNLLESYSLKTEFSMPRENVNPPKCQPTKS